MRLELHEFPGGGMAEIQMRAMQRHPVDWVCAAAIGLITQYRMPLLGQVHADLMFAPRLQPDFKERGFPISLHHVHVRDCQLSGFRVRRRVDAVGGILRQIRPDREIIRFHAALHDRNISAARGVNLELILQALLRFNRLRENE